MACNHQDKRIWVGKADGVYCSICGNKIDLKAAPIKKAPAKKAEPAAEAPAKKAPAKKATTGRAKK
jgi:uncharacterized Zn finger protein (UPF0148 family)